MYNIFIYPYILLFFLNPLPNTGVYDVAKINDYQIERSDVLSAKSISLEKRYNDKWVNDVFKDNILLTLGYLSGEIGSKSDINWDKIRESKSIAFTLGKGETFAFHDQIMEPYKESTVKTTNAHFNSQDGFRSDGHLVGDGVCHLASLLYWTSQSAGLTAHAPTNHDFALVNEVPKEYGVSIYDLPGSYELSSRQNLYITNNFDETVTFIFHYDGNNLNLEITKSN